MLSNRHARMDFTVRTMRKRDIERAARLERLNLRNLWGPADLNTAYDREDSMPLVAVLPGRFGEEIIGYCVALVNDEHTRMTFLNVCVHPEWQRCAVATAMVELSASEFSDIPELKAVCPASCVASCSFWASLGFKVQREVKCTPPALVYLKTMDN